MIELSSLVASVTLRRDCQFRGVAYLDESNLHERIGLLLLLQDGGCGI